MEGVQSGEVARARPRTIRSCSYDSVRTLDTLSRLSSYSPSTVRNIGISSSVTVGGGGAHALTEHSIASDAIRRVKGFMTGAFRADTEAQKSGTNQESEPPISPSFSQAGPMIEKIES